MYASTTVARVRERGVRERERGVCVRERGVRERERGVRERVDWKWYCIHKIRSSIP